MNTADERRRFFRIDDSVHLSLRVVPQAELSQRVKDLEQDRSDGFALCTDLTAISQQVSASLRRIESAHPDIAEYLKALDRKLDLLARAFLAAEVDVSDKPVRAVNLSAGGMALHGREPFAVGTVLEIKLLLVPSYTGILTLGTVVDCTRLDDTPAEDPYPYQLRIDFSFMRELDRDALIRHVLLKQAEWLRQRKGRDRAG
jgi:hypothetical protein